MKNENSVTFEDWFEKGDADVRIAGILLEKEEIEGAALHIQQALEKYLKGYIVYRTGNVRYVHDLSELLDEAVKYDNDLLMHKDFLHSVTTYYIGSRYPGGFYVGFDEEEVELAFATMNEIIEHIKRRITESERRD